jgi:hypothetical protein
VVFYFDGVAGGLIPASLYVWRCDGNDLARLKYILPNMLLRWICAKPDRAYSSISQ